MTLLPPTAASAGRAPHGVRLCIAAQRARMGRAPCRQRARRRSRGGSRRGTRTPTPSPSPCHPPTTANSAKPAALHSFDRLTTVSRSDIFWRAPPARPRRAAEGRLPLPPCSPSALPAPSRFSPCTTRFPSTRINSRSASPFSVTRPRFSFPGLAPVSVRAPRVVPVDTDNPGGLKGLRPLAPLLPSVDFACSFVFCVRALRPFNFGGLCRSPRTGCSSLPV